MPEYEALKTRFEGMNAQVVGISVDSTYCNKAWADSLGGITYPLLSDFWPHGATAKTYGVFNEERGIAIRGTFIIDKQGIVRYEVVNPATEPRDPDAYRKALAALS